MAIAPKIENYQLSETWAQRSGGLKPRPDRTDLSVKYDVVN
jgi:hypothetical protein